MRGLYQWTDGDFGELAPHIDAVLRERPVELDAGTEKVKPRGLGPGTASEVPGLGRAAHPRVWRA